MTGSSHPDHWLVRLETLALIGVGGFAGSNLRFLSIGVFDSVVGILFVNVLGCLALGFLVYEAQSAGLVDRHSRLVFSTGFLSSLTTYSGFAIQTALAETPLLVVAIVIGNYGLGIAGVLVGRSLALSIRRPEPGGEPA